VWRFLLFVLLAATGGLCSFLGVRAIGTGSAAQPIRVSGVLASYDLHTRHPVIGDVYEAWVSSGGASDVGPYYLNSREFHPGLPDLSSRQGADVSLWYDKGTDNAIALEVDDRTYASDYFRFPRSKYWDLVARGILLAIPGFLILIGLAAWLVRKAGTSREVLPPPDEASSRKLFEYPAYPRSPIPLSREPAAIVADFQEAVASAGRPGARSESLLKEKREEIIEALFNPVSEKAGVVSPDELDALKTSLQALQTFVPAADAEAVVRYEQAQKGQSSAALPDPDREQAEAVLARIAAGQRAVANFRYEEPEFLKSGADFMIEETLKWSNPRQADESFNEELSQVFGYFVYVPNGLICIGLYFATGIRWGSMPFWALGTQAILASAVTATVAAALMRLSGGLLLGLIVAAGIAAPFVTFWLANRVALSL
jgi:hypothetical protein